jgi:hypothetical protein
MSWYVAHIVMVVKFKEGSQRSVPAWENIVLISAADEIAAARKGESIGRASEGDDDGSFKWMGKPATWEFVGIRKITECALAAERPASGDEISYQELEFDSLAIAKRYAEGETVSVKHRDQIGVASGPEYAADTRAKRKRA